MTDIRIGIRGRPPVKQNGQALGLSAARREIPLEHEHEHEIALSGEVCDVLSNEDIAFGTRESRNRGIVGAAQAEVRDMRCVVIDLFAEQSRCRGCGTDDGGPVELLTALLAIPDERPGSSEAGHVLALDDALRAVLHAMALQPCHPMR